MAGRAAERMLLDGEAVVPADDLRQARELAMLICASEEAVESFIAHSDIVARDLLLPYGAVIMTLQLVLRIKRSLDAVEIDNVISTTLAQQELAVEHARRRQWQQRVENAAAFKPE
jgi:hypothetical protein